MKGDLYPITVGNDIITPCRSPPEQRGNVNVLFVKPPGNQCYCHIAKRRHARAGSMDALHTAYLVPWNENFFLWRDAVEDAVRGQFDIRFGGMVSQ